MDEGLVGRDTAKRMFREAVEAAGGVCAFARLHGRSQGAICDAYHDCAPVVPGSNKPRRTKHEVSDELLALAGAVVVKRYMVARSRQPANEGAPA